MLQFPFQQSFSTATPVTVTGNTGTAAGTIGDAPEQKSPAAASNAPSRRVLVMDDEPAILELTRRMLQMKGYDVATALEGQSAVDQYKEAMAAGRPFQVVILDLTVPGGMGGLDTFAALRELDPGVKAIVSSGYGQINYKAHGIAAMTPKPYKIDDLVGSITQVIGSGQ